MGIVSGGEFLISKRGTSGVVPWTRQIFMLGLPRGTLLLSTYRAAFEVAALNISRLTHLLAVFIRRIN
jgi:hypothetical protein